MTSQLNAETGSARQMHTFERGQRGNQSVQLRPTVAAGNDEAKVAARVATGIFYERRINLCRQQMLFQRPRFRFGFGVKGNDRSGCFGNFPTGRAQRGFHKSGVLIQATPQFFAFWFADNLTISTRGQRLFYVLDRINGEFLLGKPFVKKMNWSSGIGPDGNPQLLPTNQPTKAGVKTCPSVRGATYWLLVPSGDRTVLCYGGPRIAVSTLLIAERWL